MYNANIISFHHVQIAPCAILSRDGTDSWKHPSLALLPQPRGALEYIDLLLRHSILQHNFLVSFMSTILAAAINHNFASAAAHTYRPFYLPNEDTLPASDSLDAAKREYFMAAINALNVSGDEVSNRFVMRRLDSENSVLIRRNTVTHFAW
jgi:hypothetical protein